MIAALFSFLPGRAWLYGALAAALIAATGWHVLHEGAQRRAAVEQAVMARDGIWQAQIAKANAEAAALLASTQARVDELAAALITSRTQLDATLAAIEAENAKLPAAPSCGLDRGRVRLLDRL